MNDFVFIVNSRFEGNFQTVLTFKNATAKNIELIKV